MITLAIEVVYYKRRDARDTAIVQIKPKDVDHLGDSTPPPMYQSDDRIKAKTFSDRSKFGAADGQNPAHVSYVAVYPRKSIHSVRNNALVDWMDWIGVMYE